MPTTAALRAPEEGKREDPRKASRQETKAGTNRRAHQRLSDNLNEVGGSRRVLSFFFSSRRRHTRLQGDWSSDVCSSDLLDGQQKLVRGRNEDLALRLGTPGLGPGTFAFIRYDHLIPDSAKPRVQIEYPAEIGRASCRERV